MILKKYRTLLLTSIAVLALAVGAAAQAPKTPQDDPNMKEIFSYVLTMDKVHKLGAVQSDMVAFQKSNPDMKKQMDADDSDGNLDQLAQRIQKYPPVVAILKKDGLTPREYIVGTLALIQAGMAVSFKKSGTYKDYPPKMLTTINPVNLTFVEQHWDEISKSMPAFQNEGDDAK